MQYTIIKILSGISLIQPEEGSGELVRAKLDYTFRGKGVHNGTEIDINSGDSVEVDIPTELLEEAEEKIMAKIASKYKSDI